LHGCADAGIVDKGTEMRNFKVMEDDDQMGRWGGFVEGVATGKCCKRMWTNMAYVNTAVGNAALGMWDICWDAAQVQTRLLVSVTSFLLPRR